MKKFAAIIVFAALLTVSTAAKPVQADSNSANSGFIPGDLFYPIENFVEELEVAIAGFVGGPDFKSKALANNADEALSEAKALAEKNRSDKATKMIEKYSKLMNKSQGLAERSGNANLSVKLRNISERNTQVLEEVKKKVPKQARDAIEKAIEKSGKSKVVPGKGQNKSVPGGEKVLNKTENLSVPGKSSPRGNVSERGNNISENMSGSVDPGKTVNRTEGKLDNRSEGSERNLSGSRPSKDGDSNSSGPLDEGSSGGTDNSNENPLVGTGGSLL